MDIQTKKTELRERQVEMAKWADGVKTYDAATIKELNERNDTLNNLREEISNAEKASKILADNKADIEKQETLEKGFFGASDGRKEDRAALATKKAEEGMIFSSLGGQFVKNEAFTKFDRNKKEGPTAKYGEFGLKTVFQETSANSGTVGYAPQIIRNGVIVEMPFYQPKMNAFLDHVPVSLNAILYQQEIVNTNGSAFVHEDDSTVAESAFQLQDATETIKKARVTLPVSDDMLDDAPYMMAFIDGRLRRQLARTVDTAILSGNGSGDNLTGLLNRSGIQTNTVSGLAGAGNNVDALHKAMTQVMVVSEYDADGIVMHPLNWETILLTKSSDGLYIYGDPYMVKPNRIWGLDVVDTKGIPQGTGLIGAFHDSVQVADRRDVTMSIATEHASNWLQGRIVIKLELRFGLLVYRPAALYSLTQLT